MSMMTMKMGKWRVALIDSVSDVLNYVNPTDLDGQKLDLLAEILRIATSTETGRITKHKYGKQHKKILEAGLTTLPTTKRAIEKYGD